MLSERWAITEAAPSPRLKSLNTHPELSTVERHRSTLTGLAYRMLGDWAEAEDIAQETLIRWHRLSPEARAEIATPKAWLLRAASRRALDQLKSARRRRLEYVGPWLPEPWLQDESTAADRLEADESITMALMVALERLSPSERAAYLLRDVFGLPFSEIAAAIGKSAEACRQLASRARAAIRSGKPRFELRADRHAALLHAFLKASAEGDVEDLTALLAEDVTLHSDGGAGVRAARKVLSSREIVTRFFAGLARKKRRSATRLRYELRVVNGLPAALIFENDQLSTLLSLAVAEGRIQAIYQQRNPGKLRLLQSVRKPT